MDTYASTTRFRYRLLTVLIGIILMMQACSAANLKVEVTGPSHDVYIGNNIVIYAHLFDPDFPGVMMKNGYGHISVYNSSGVRTDAVVITNSSGWAQTNYIPQTAGTYWLESGLEINYNDIPGLPDAGVQRAVDLGPHFNAIVLYAAPSRTVVMASYFTPASTTATTSPSVTSLPVTTSTLVTVAPPVTTALTAQTTTQAVPAQATSAHLAASADSIPPVTILTLSGTEDGSGGYISEATCTLTAIDNAGGSGVGTTQYSFNGTTWYTYTKPVSVIKAGLTTLYYRSADNAGNTEVAQVKAVVVSGPAAAPAGTTVAAATAIQAGSGSSLPFWLMAVIILIIIAAIGGILYWKSRQKE